jgi:hypothetical protein
MTGFWVYSFLFDPHAGDLVPVFPVPGKINQLLLLTGDLKSNFLLEGCFPLHL